jgi:polysaccharide export outer membrane protein
VVLQPGDTLKFQFLNHPELTDEQMIRPDGKVSLQLAGEVQAAGKTPEELHQELMSLYGPKVKNPEINVVVRALDSRRAYVGGEVKAPGFVPLTSPKTALQAIIESGGFVKESAQLRNVVIIRQRDGRQYARSLDLRKAIYSGCGTPFYLEPNDVVYVPRTVIDRVDQWVEQYINEIIPRNVHYTFTDSDYESENRSQTFQIVVP